jgi:predicted dehydrogenase
MMRAAIIGAGLMGRWHAHYARQCGAALVGVADSQRPEPELKQRFRGAAVFRDAEMLVKELKPDVLHVCTPADTHERIVEVALRAGAHVLVEKPLALTAESTERLMVQAAERGVLLTPVHQYAFQDGMLRAEATLRQIGRPLHFDVVICSAGGTQLRGEQLDNLVADILPHPLSLLDRLFPGVLGDIEWGKAQLLNGECRIFAEAHGVSVSILISLHGRPTESSLRLTCEGGTIHVDLFHGFAVVDPGVIDPGGSSRWLKITHPFTLATRTLWAAGWNLTRRAISREPAYPGLRRLIRLFYQAVAEDKDAPLTASHVVEVARVRDRLRAQATHRPV